MADPYVQTGSHGHSGILILTFSSVGAQLIGGSNNHFRVNLGRQVELAGAKEDYEVTLVSLRYGVDSALSNDDVFVYSDLIAPTSLVNGVDSNLVKTLLNQNGAGPFAFEDTGNVVLWHPLQNTRFNSVEVEARLGGASLPSTTVSTLATFAIRHVRRS